MMKRFVVPAWALLLTIVLLLAACGPAVSTEEATRAAGGDTSADVETEGDESAIEDDFAAEGEDGPVGIPTVEGPQTETDSGLIYIETQAGDGRTPEEGDIVTMNIIGMLDDGTVFADTYAEGAPITATATEEDLFAGWKEGLLLMKEGGKARFIIPPDLAFGAEGAGGIIPPDATVTMDVELITATAPPQPTAVDADDLTTTDSGLQYYDLTVGKGDEPVEGQEVVTHYTAWLEDGTFIASSIDQGEPLTFPLGTDTVFAGWEEGLMTMQKGGKRYLVIPAELALGEEGGGRVPPGATLLMEVELIDILPLVVPTAVDEDDFTTTESGLRYYDIVEGDGDVAEAGSSVTVNYTGWLTNNIKFDSSLDEGRTPFTFTLGTGAVIPGWDEGVEGMRVGGKRQLLIPAELGYGETGGGTIPPGATLIFDVELLEVAPAPTE